MTLRSRVRAWAWGPEPAWPSSVLERRMGDGRCVSAAREADQTAFRSKENAAAW